MSRNCTSHKWLYVLIGVKVTSVSFKFWCILDLVILQCRKHSDWLWLITPTRQESLTSLANSTVLSHTEVTEVTLQSNGKGNFRSVTFFPSPIVVPLAGLPLLENRIWLLLSTIAPGHVTIGFLRPVHLSMGLSCGTIVFLHQLLEGLPRSLHSLITCGTKKIWCLRVANISMWPTVPKCGICGTNPWNGHQNPSNKSGNILINQWI